MSFQNEKYYRVKVNHNGACGDFVFKQDEPIDLPESIINALGTHAIFVDLNGNQISDPRT